MNEKIYLKKIASVLKHVSLFCICVMALIMFFASPTMAFEETLLFGKTLSGGGFINQGVGYGIGGDEFDTKEGLQSLYFDVELEARLDVNSDFRIFVSTILSGNWAYSVLSSDDEWESKGFDKSSDNLEFDTDFNQLLQECHFTWAPGNMLLRVGKQIVVWGDSDNSRITDQINPLDQSRGVTDVEFESTIVPIWLAKLEYYFETEGDLFQDLGIELVFNPNADFVADKGPAPGNDFAGIWGVDVEIPLGGPYPMDFAHLGYLPTTLEDPDTFDSDYFEYGARLTAVADETIMTLNYFYGRENSPISLPSGAPVMTPSDFDGRLVMSIPYAGYYPRLHFVGFTVARDFENIGIRALGGVSPIVRLEAFYAIDSTFAGAAGFEEHDEYRWALNVEWKIKINALNPKAYFSVLAQVDNRHIMDYPSVGGLNSTTGAVEEDNYKSLVVLGTTYFHNKLAPQIVWVQDWAGEATINIIQATYVHSHKWNFKLGAVLFSGEKDGADFALANKDHLFLNASFKF